MERTEVGSSRQGVGDDDDHPRATARHATHDDDAVVELAAEEFHAAAPRALQRLGLTYAQSADQARRRDFSSAQAYALRAAIGGTVGL